jgi:hypothetical protein
METNKELSRIFLEIAELLDLNVPKKDTLFRIMNYKKAAKTLESFNQDVSLVYKEKGLKGIKEILGVGDKIAKKIEEYLKKKKINDFEKLKKETAIRQVVTHYFKTKGLSLGELKTSARKMNIVYSRFTKPAKQLLELSGSIEKAKEAIDKVAQWASSRNLDYAIETVFKKWLELDKLKPKEVVKKPFFRNMPMVWSETKKKWYAIDSGGEWLEFAGKENEIEWRVVK